MNFNIVAEGNTDFRVLRIVIESIIDDAVVNILVPSVDAYSHKTNGRAGWENVVDYLKSNLLVDALDYSDYLVVQIDTDECEHINYNAGSITLADRNMELFYETIQGKIIEWINSYCPDTYEKYKEKIIFAICIHSLECWLLGLYVRQNELSRIKIHSGFEHLNRALSRHDLCLSEPKDPNQYEFIARPFRKKKNHRASREYSYSLDRFISRLESLEL
jgi:hypothetical protein